MLSNRPLVRGRIARAGIVAALVAAGALVGWRVGHVDGFIAATHNMPLWCLQSLPDSVGP